MNQMLPQCQNLQEQVQSLLELLHQEPTLRSQDITPVESSLRKAVSPKFEIVFAGAFSAGKSMLINALLERELLYSAEGHATATECRVEYAEPGQERVVLTFSSEAEIREQAVALCEQLGLPVAVNINQSEVIDNLRQSSELIIQQEGGKDKTKKAKQANALVFLLEGYVANRDRIQTVNNATYPMEQFNFSNLQQAADYARRGRNSAVLKRIEYYCNHPLLKDGNVIVDTPGIDAPVERDAQLTYDKIKHPDTSAVACILKYAKDGDMAKEETELLEMMRGNSGIRDRVFYVFNYIDITWFKPQLRQRLDNIVSSQFQPPTRVYKTSGLLGFYGSLLRTSGNPSNGWGLDTFLAGPEAPHPFISEFNNYCANSGKLSPSQFRIEVRGYETPNENYVRILNQWGKPLIEQLIQDSGIEEFRAGITNYLTKEKRPQLFANLADDLEPLCISLKKHYQALQQDLDSQPREIEQMKERELQRLSQQLNDIGNEFCQHIETEVIEVIDSKNLAFNRDFQELKVRMVNRLDELLFTFSVGTAHNQAIRSHRRNAVVPLLAILAEAFYYLANELENVLVESSKELIINFFKGLIERVRQAEYYRNLYRLLGNDGGIEQNLKLLEVKVADALVNEARTECDRYVREQPEFYAEATYSMWQLRQTLQQTCRSYDYESMKEAEPAIKQLLKFDFDPKVSQTINRIFRQTINETINTHLSPGVQQQAGVILQQYERARTYLGQTLEKEAEEKIKENQRSQGDVESNVVMYNEAVNSINSCLEAMQLDRHKLPLLDSSNLIPIFPELHVSTLSLDDDGIVDSKMSDAVMES